MGKLYMRTLRIIHLLTVNSSHIYVAWRLQFRVGNMIKSKPVLYMCSSRVWIMGNYSNQLSVIKFANVTSDTWVFTLF